MKLIGAPKMVVWAEKIRQDRLKAWQKESPEIFAAIESVLNQQTSADWWITYKDKTLELLCNHLLSGRMEEAAASRKRKPTDGR